jgi:NhaA family Na+:H+ antiporter
MVKIKQFLQSETAPGVILICSGVIAMILSNSGFADAYFYIIDAKKPINFLFFVNDVLMTIFFLDVGLEIKHQVVVGHLSKLRQIFLPIIAACGGVILPALIFLSLNFNNEVARHGWAIPTATDIAFALGVITLLGKRIPLSLRVLLLTIAVIDDLIAILIIALFYSSHISFVFLGLSALCALLLITMNVLHIKSLVHYLIVGMLLWICMLSSGMHPTLSGVIVALTMPLSIRDTIQKQLFFWVAFIILPIFAFTNAGISLTNIYITQLLEPVPLGIALGLLIGKQLGIFSFAWMAVKTKIAILPNDIEWQQLYGMAIICGIGFTMSIFIGNLAYTTANPDLIVLNKLGVLVGSTLSAIIGYAFLRLNNK